MNWEAISAMAEVLGVIAVVVSVLYLAAQVRRQTKEIRTAAIHETTQNYTEAVTPYLEPQLAELWARGTKNFESLNDGERIQMISAFTINLRSFQDAFYQAVGQSIRCRRLGGHRKFLRGCFVNSWCEPNMGIEKENFQYEIPAIRRFDRTFILPNYLIVWRENALIKTFHLPFKSYLLLLLEISGEKRTL